VLPASLPGIAGKRNSTSSKPGGHHQRALTQALRIEVEPSQREHRQADLEQRIVQRAGAGLLVRSSTNQPVATVVADLRKALPAA